MSAFILLGNPDYWPEDSPTRRSLMQDAIAFEQGEALEKGKWSTHRVHGYEPEDRIYLLLVGKGPRGIVASGRVDTEEVSTDVHHSDDRKTSKYLEVDWDSTIRFDEVLSKDQLPVIAPNTGWRPQNGGMRIMPSDEAALEEAWQDHLSQLGYPPAGKRPRGGGTSPRTRKKAVFIPTGYTQALTKVRKHQRAFRRLLLAHYPHECAACGLDIVEILEAAHLKADRDRGEASVENGRLLCPNHHRALDSKLIDFDGRTNSFKLRTGSREVPPTRGE